MRITEPTWNRGGHVNPDGSLSISFANVMRALVKQYAAVQAQVDAVESAADTGPTAQQLLDAMFGTNGIDIFGSIESGVEIRGPGASGASVPLLVDGIYTVAANTQVLFHHPIQVDGTLVVDGVLVEV